MIDNNEYNRIESYLLGQMSQDEMELFEAEIIANKELAKMFNEQEKEHLILEALVEKDLLKKMDAWKTEELEIKENEQHKKWVSVFYRGPWYWALAAILFLLLGLILWPYKNTDTNIPIIEEQKQIESREKSSNELKEGVDVAKNNDIIEKNPEEEDVVIKKVPDQKMKEPKQEIKPIPNNQSNKYIALAIRHTEPIDFSGINVRGTKSRLESALEDLKENRILDGENALKVLKVTDPDNLSISYYLGLALFSRKEYKIAIPHLKLISDEIFLHTERAQWLLCLAYLHTGKNEKAIEALILIADDDGHSYYEKGRALKKDLEIIHR